MLLNLVSSPTRLGKTNGEGPTAEGGNRNSQAATFVLGEKGVGRKEAVRIASAMLGEPMRIPRRCLRSMLVLTVVLAPSTGCRRFDPAEPTDEVRDFTGRGGRYTRSAFLSDSRGWVFFNVYLPPGWSPGGPEAYPLIIFLHGQMGDEHRFTDNVRASQLNGWIENGSVAPFVLIAPRGADRRGATYCRAGGG